MRCVIFFSKFHLPIVGIVLKTSLTFMKLCFPKIIISIRFKLFIKFLHFQSQKVSILKNQIILSTRGSEWFSGWKGEHIPTKELSHGSKRKVGGNSLAEDCGVSSEPWPLVKFLFGHYLAYPTIGLKAEVTMFPRANVPHWPGDDPLKQNGWLKGPLLITDRWTLEGIHSVLLRYLLCWRPGIRRSGASPNM